MLPYLQTELGRKGEETARAGRCRLRKNASQWKHLGIEVVHYAYGPDIFAMIVKLACE